jgi:catechol 2,3-dioxygenase-like lactoylglutathione lyase family enzyme
MDRDGFFLSGIQQVGFGVADVAGSFAWCRRAFGTDIRIFEDAGEAALMARYTGGAVHARHAILAANLQGGSALEIWQFTDRTPLAAAFPVRLGDLGIFCPRIKTRDAVFAHAHFSRLGAPIGAVARNPAGEAQFFLSDPGGNHWQVVETDEGWFSRGRHPTGGVAGCLVGVSDIDRSLPLYRGVLGYRRLLCDERGVFPDWIGLPGGGERYRRVLLSLEGPRPGAFGRLLGPSRIELVQPLERRPRKIFGDRFWGDLGFIHLCFDVHGMDGLSGACRAAGFPFTVDSASAFSMGEAAGRFAYLEDPDGTLVEFVETRRMAVARRLGLYLDLSRRDPRRPLPGALLRLLALNRVRG